ncbi:Acid proteases protein [Dioscorea alata]|uniref:Acid proteases protein n=1 Tax=Dioscorea alata TaxID=55571 RepID=A0ACB7ULW1_DIOAL|nr:Acid proteases protein [Dioscorea alata]
MYQPHSPVHQSPLQSSISPCPPRPPKIKIPLFSGEHVLSWLFQINHFFHFHQTPKDQRISIVAFYLTGQALQWFHWLHSTSQLSHWDDFVRKLELRFGPSSLINHDAALFKLRQSSTKLLNCFLSGLRDDIQRELYLLKPVSLHEAMGMAKLVKDKLNASRPSIPRVPFHRPLALPPPPTAPRPSSFPIKRLTPMEMAARREKGLCFNCDSKFTPGHKCNPALFLYSPSISFHALMGHTVPATLKLAGSINGQDVFILVDGGSTNNFMQSRLATHLKLVVGDIIMTIHLILVPIYGTDCVLGVQWLLQLGPVIFYYENLWMEFGFQGNQVRLHRLSQPQTQVARLASLRK